MVAVPRDGIAHGARPNVACAAEVESEPCHISIYVGSTRAYAADFVLVLLVNV